MLVKLIELLMSEIRYGKASLPEACLQISKSVEGQVGACLQEVYREFEENPTIPFRKILCQRMERELIRLPLPKEERGIFLAPFAEQGYRDENMQLKSFECALVQLQYRIDEEEQELKGKCGLAVKLGIMGGLLTVLVLL